MMPETENDFMTWVLMLAKLFGWKVAHFRAARTNKGWRTPVQADGKGFPDLVLVKGDKLIFVELKSKKGKLSTEQRAWLQTLCHAATVCIWRPGDRESIQKILEGE